MQRDSFVGSREFNEFYTPFHMNFGCYFFGVLAALLYDHISSNQLKISQNKLFHTFFYILIPVGILWLFSGHTFFQSYYDKNTSLWTNSIFAAIHRNVFGLGLGLLIIGMSANCGCKYLRV